MTEQASEDIPRSDVVGNAAGRSALSGPRYTIGRALGAGGAGTVHAGVDHLLGRRVAIKVLHPEYANEPTHVERFVREARASAAIGHPNIVQVTDFVRAVGAPPMLVMELLEGESLRSLIDREGPLPPERASFIVVQTLAALSAAHRAGIVHRDVKPSNVFRCDGTPVADFVKLVDFGIAKLMEGRGPDLTEAGLALGTLVYMAPEQAAGQRVDARTDLYSAALVLYELLVGRRPHSPLDSARLTTELMQRDPTPVGKRRPGTHGVLASLIVRALARSPADRFASADEMLAVLMPLARWANPSIAHEAPPSEALPAQRSAPATVPMLAVVPSAGIATRREPPQPPARGAVTREPSSTPPLLSAPEGGRTLVSNRSASARRTAPATVVVPRGALLAVAAIVGLGVFLFVRGRTASAPSGSARALGPAPSAASAASAAPAVPPLTEPALPMAPSAHNAVERRLATRDGGTIAPTPTAARARPMGPPALTFTSPMSAKFLSAADVVAAAETRRGRLSECYTRAPLDPSMDLGACYVATIDDRGFALSVAPQHPVTPALSSCVSTALFGAHFGTPKLGWNTAVLCVTAR